MKLTGLQIFKYMPGGKKQPEANCKKCGFPTCMAFSMKLAKGLTTLDKCEYVSDELRAIFEESSQLQQNEITFGEYGKDSDKDREKKVKLGNETVMFRHDKKFVNGTCLSVSLDSSDLEFDSKLDNFKNYSIERVGEDLKISAVALFDTDKTFCEKAQKITAAQMPLILISSNFDKLKETLNLVKDSKPAVYYENNNIDKIAELEQEYKTPVIISGNTPEELAVNSESALAKGVKNIILNLKEISAKNMVQNLTYIRRLAIEEKFKPFGFPVISFQKDITDFPKDPVEQGILGSVLLCKYSNALVLADFNPAIMYALLTLRQNIFTDPEKPLQIDAKIYPIGEPDENSPVIVTTNFALTYFTVVSEIESSNISSHLVITSSDGMSVLTAWSADKFTGEIIAKAFKEYGVDKLVNHRRLIIPGYVANMKEEIEEEMPDWEVIIGSNEAVDIVDFLKKYQKLYPC